MEVNEINEVLSFQYKFHQSSNRFLIYLSEFSHNEVEGDTNFIPLITNNCLFRSRL